MQDDSYNTDGSKSSARPDSVEGDIVERLRERDAAWQDRVDGWLAIMADAGQPASDEAETIMRRTTMEGEAADHIAALRARCEALEGALVKARDLLGTVEQTTSNVWFSFDPEADVCDTYAEIEAALSSSTPSPEAK